MWSPLFLGVFLLQVSGILGKEKVLPEIQNEDEIVAALKNIREDQPVGKSIVKVIATEEPGAEISYKINDKTYFIIDEKTGVISLKTTWDYEDHRGTSVVNLVITARDPEDEETEFSVDAILKNINDVPPEFTDTQQGVELYEDAKPGTTVMSVSVTDKDQTANGIIRVKCVNEDPETCEIFSLKRDGWASNLNWKGFISLSRPLDFEKKESYSIRLQASDGENTRDQEFQVKVLDVNDSPPAFWRGAYTKSIPEGNPVGEYIDYVLALDSDEVDKRPIRYELIGDATAMEYFDVTKVTGNITNKLNLDYEDDVFGNGPKEFELVIKARELLEENPEKLGDDKTTTATTTVTIVLQDVNDNCPLFGKDVYTARVPENYGVGNPVLDVKISDADFERANKRFNVSMDGEQTFELVAARGSLQIPPHGSSVLTIKVANNSKLDYETGQRTFRLKIIATDLGNGCSSTTLVNINVADVNDESPKFQQSEYTAYVREDAVAGTSVITITATDGDSGSFGTDGLLYSFSGSTDLFRIHPTSGVVTVESCATPGKAPCLDYEKIGSHFFIVNVNDNKGKDPSKHESASLTINVINVNDNPPKFSGSYNGSIFENEIRLTTPLIIEAVDPDGDEVSYSLVNDVPDAGFWTVNGITGEITAKNPIQITDPLDGLTFAFNAKASDGKFDNIITPVRITVIDINNNVPKFSNSVYIVTIREDHPGGTLVYPVTVTDGDSPTSRNGILDITIKDGFQRFTIPETKNQPDGSFLAEVYTQVDATFDYDRKSAYELILEARDRGIPYAKTGTATLIVNIEDINNKAPYFDPFVKSASISEIAQIGSFVTKVTAIDEDADPNLSISFGSPIKASNQVGSVTDPSLYENLFVITSDGVVRTNAALDRDIVSFVEIPLVVVDTNANPRQTGTGSLFIRIIEYNDQRPKFDMPRYKIYVLEETAKGTFIYSLRASDEDDRISAYQLTRNPNNLFSIDIRTGALVVNGRLDYEAFHNVTLTAVAFDSGTPKLSGSAEVFIEIVNINDNAPLFSKVTYEIELPEDRTVTGPILYVSATDRDEGDYGEVRYTTDDQYFTVDNMTGKITMKPGQKLDREEMESYTFEVTAYDSPSDPSVRLATTTQVYVVLGDRNDNCPIFEDGNSYTDEVIETAHVHDEVLELFATDADYGSNRSIKFMIDPASANPPEANQLFYITSFQSTWHHIQSGRIKVKSSLRHKSGSYRFTVIAADQNGENITGDMCSTPANVTIKIIPAFNTAPEWILPPTRDFSINVLESQYNGMLVYDCKAVDGDAGKQGIVDYYFNIGQTLQSLTDEFRINRITGVISARTVFDREQVSSYVLTVVARDQGTPSASSQTVLIVNVLDVNDNDPEFPMRNGQTIPYLFEVTEGMSPSAVDLIGVVSATDKDSDHKNNKVYYKIVAGNVDGMFDLGRESGELRLSARAANGLDRETKSSYSMDVLAYNDVSDDHVIRYRRKRSTNPSIVTVIVTVKDINDSPPKFVSPDYYGCVQRDAAFGRSILKVEAVDQDEDRALFITYTKISETTDNFFKVDSTLGIIRNSKLLYNIDSRVSVLRIRANDDHSQGQIAETDVKIFVTDKDNEVKLEIGQPSADVRYYKDQLVRTMINSSVSPPIAFVCIREIRDHVGEDGTYSYTMSDVFLSAVYMDQDNNYKIYSGDQLSSKLGGQLLKYESLHVKAVKVETEEDDLSLTEDPVLAIGIIVLLLIILAIFLVCLACCMIFNSKRRKMKKLRAEEHRPAGVVMHQAPPEVGTNVNPVYDNKGFEDGDEYAVVHKVHSAPQPVAAAPVVPVVVPVADVEPAQEVSGEEPVPFIVTEPIMTEEEPPMQPPPEDFFIQEPEVVPVSPEPEPEPVIETVIETEVVEDDLDQGPGPSPTLEEDEIAVEFGDVEDSSSPRRSPSPPASPSEEEYHHGTNVM